MKENQSCKIKSNTQLTNNPETGIDAEFKHVLFQNDDVGFTHEKTAACGADLFHGNDLPALRSVAAEEIAEFDRIDFGAAENQTGKQVLFDK